MSEQFESLKRVFVKRIKEDGYTKTTEDFKKHCEKLKRALKDARYEVSVEKSRIRNREYQRKYREQKKQRQKDRIEQLEAKLKELKEGEDE